MWALEQLLVKGRRNELEQCLRHLNLFFQYCSSTKIFEIKKYEIYEWIEKYEYEPWVWHGKCQHTQPAMGLSQPQS